MKDNQIKSHSKHIQPLTPRKKNHPKKTPSKHNAHEKNPHTLSKFVM